MKYFEVTFQISPYSELASDILCALMADEGFETFEPISSGLKAWVQQSLYSSSQVNATLELFPLQDTTITYSVAEAPDENWNIQWEKEGFQPIIIQDKESRDVLIVVHDTSHTEVPVARYDICINPCQAFGTGTHETTRMILRQLLDMPMDGRYVIDAGTGTGILAILCRMLGASKVLAYDIDEWSVRNAKSNMVLNGIEDGVSVLLGDSGVLSNNKHNLSEDGDMPTLLIANINRNILLTDMQAFSHTLKYGGELLLSGFYTEDVPLLLNKSSQYGFVPVLQQEDNNWALLLLKKEKYS